MKVKHFVIASLLCQQGFVAAFAVGPPDETGIRSAWTLYTQQKYVPSADAFEALIRTSSPNARLYYYSAVASKAAGRNMRAMQLCQYISTNFPASPEASYVQKLFPGNTSKPVISSSGGSLPEHLKGRSVDELMQSEEGRQALKEMMSSSSSSSASSSSSSSSKSRTSVASASSRTTASASSSSASGLLPRGQIFTSDLIAIEGADGITHFGPYSRCEFECSLAALALLPKGRTLLASMIKCPNSQDIYVVRFPGNGGEYQITPQKMEEYGIKDKALWASLIHCAEWMSNSKGDFHDGLTLLTGKTAEVLHANSTTEQTLSKFIEEAVKAQNPIVCQSGDFGNLAPVAEEWHSYTIIGFDSGSGMITIRNPHGANSRRFRLKTDPDGKSFSQMNDGVFKIHISIFPKYFPEVARSSI